MDALCAVKKKGIQRYTVDHTVHTGNRYIIKKGRIYYQYIVIEIARNTGTKRLKLFIPQFIPVLTVEFILIPLETLLRNQPDMLSL